MCIEVRLELQDEDPRNLFLWKEILCIIHNMTGVINGAVTVNTSGTPRFFGGDVLLDLSFPV